MPIIRVNNQTIFLLSDTHGKHRLVEIPQNVDMIIHCGDSCNDGNLDEILDFFQWFSELDIQHKVFVHGNHDLPFELEPEESEKLITRNVHWLNDKSVTLNGIKIKALCPFFYFHPINFSEKIDILVSHYPPFGFLDNGIGSKELRDFVLKTKSKYFVFGHNHLGTGQMEYENIQFINASIFNELCQKENR